MSKYGVFTFWKDHILERSVESDNSLQFTACQIRWEGDKNAAMTKVRLLAQRFGVQRGKTTWGEGGSDTPSPQVWARVMGAGRCGSVVMLRPVATSG